jgi:MraZ protein
MSESILAAVLKLDVAGRIRLNEDQRKALGDSLVMSCGFDNYIAIYTPDEWQRLNDVLGRLPRYDPNVQDLKRLLLAPAVTCKVDGQGRVRLPEILLEWADLGGGKLDAFVTPGDDGRWECWELKKWKAFNQDHAPALKGFLATQLAEHGAKQEEAGEATN